MVDITYRNEGKNVVLTAQGETNARVDYVELADVATRVKDTLFSALHRLPQWMSQTGFAGLEPVKLDAASSIQTIVVSQRVVFMRLTTAEKRKLRQTLEGFGIEKR